MKQIYLIRHGETELNRLRIVQGSGVDSSLNDTGRAQAKAFFDKYQNVDFEVVITSNLQRTHQTVQHFLAQDIPWIKTGDINEISWGIREGKAGTPESIAEYQALTKAWSNGDLDARLEEGESAQEMITRLSRFIEFLKNRPEKRILICSHGRAMRCLLSLMKGLGMHEMDNQKHSNTGLYRMQLIANQFIFDLENDTSHIIKE